MLNVLVNAFACCPERGSEPGMGWNWISNLAEHCNLYVITEGEWRQDIEKALDKHPFRRNLHFYYLPVADSVRAMFHNQGDWRFYHHYKQWQKRALKIAQDIINNVEVDVVHQLNIVTFREPGYLWKLGKPFVWGPIGGVSEMVKAYYYDAPVKTRILLSMKNGITMLQLKQSLHINQGFKHSDVLISAVPIVREKIREIKHRDSLLIPETGCYDWKTIVDDKRKRKEFHILWVGRFIFTKRLDIALRTIAEIKDLPNIHFHILGSGSEQQVCYYKELGVRLDIGGICEWHGRIENKKVQEIMRDADLFFFTSVAEATSTVIPEAINNCLPIVCFNACGFGPLVTEKIGRKVELTTPEQSVKDFAKTIRTLFNDKELLYSMSKNCHEALKQLLWEEKTKKLVEIYEGVVINYRNR